MAPEYFDAPLFDVTTTSYNNDESRFTVLIESEAYDVLKPLYDMFSTISEFISVSVITDFDLPLTLAVTHHFSGLTQELGFQEIGVSVFVIQFIKKLAFNGIDIMKIFYHGPVTIELPAEIVDNDGEQYITHTDNV